MIELNNDQLVFSFPEVHPLARVSMVFQRTLRIPDNDKVYPLPPGLGSFPLVHVDDYAEDVPEQWMAHGGVILPMYQAEAMWICFHTSFPSGRGSPYPFAIKVSTGKIDAVTGKELTRGLHRQPQDYLVVPGQPWLDGYCIKKGVIRQFVAMPLGEGYSAEEQITGLAEHGGLQIVIYPMKASVYDKRFPPREIQRNFESMSGWGAPAQPCAPAAGRSVAPDMGLAPGGRMKQDIYQDRFDIDDWDIEQSGRCFVHIANSTSWRSITGKNPPHRMPTAETYVYYGLPWFDYYDENLQAVPGSSRLANLKSAQALSQHKGKPIANGPVSAKPIIHLKPGQVREGDF